MRYLNYKIYLMFVFTMFFNTFIHAKATESADCLSLDCVAIPNIKNQLCTVKTKSSNGPYDDVTFFRKTDQADIFLLGNHQNGVATFAGIGFSEKGRYMWISWAEEGHRFFVFYETATFLVEGPETKTLALLDDYAFDEFISFSDEGSVTYTRQESTKGDCSGKTCISKLYLKH